MKFARLIQDYPPHHRKDEVFDSPVKPEGERIRAVANGSLFMIPVAYVELIQPATLEEIQQKFPNWEIWLPPYHLDDSEGHPCGEVGRVAHWECSARPKDQSENIGRGSRFTIWAGGYSKEACIADLADKIAKKDAAYKMEI